MLFAGASRFVLARRLMDRSGEARIAATAASTASDHEGLIGLRELENFLAGLVVVDDGPDGNLEHYVAAVPPGLVGPFAVPAPLGLMLRIETKMDQRVMALAGFHNDVAALAAVAPRRTAAW